MAASPRPRGGLRRLVVAVGEWDAYFPQFNGTEDELLDELPHQQEPQMLRDAVADVAGELRRAARKAL